MDKLNEILNANKISVALCLIGIVLIIGGIYITKNQAPPKKESYPKESLVKGIETSAEIKVDVSGAVNSPGVYSFSPDSRVEDVIKKAGGFHQKANPEYISKSLNLSQRISDGSKIYIPFVGENTGGVIGGGGVSGSTTSTGSININSADSKTLESLPGVGAVTSQKIIDGRPYQSLDDLLSKKVVGKATFEKIKGQISI